jgi:hypothetical protein
VLLVSGYLLLVISISVLCMRAAG